MICELQQQALRVPTWYLLLYAQCARAQGTLEVPRTGSSCPAPTMLHRAMRRVSPSPQLKPLLLSKGLVSIAESPRFELRAVLLYTYYMCCSGRARVSACQPRFGCPVSVVRCTMKIDAVMRLLRCSYSCFVCFNLIVSQGTIPIL